MSTVEVKIEEQAYHLVIPRKSAAPLQVIVDGQPIEVRVGNVQEMTARQVPLANRLPEDHPGHKPVMAEWHDCLRAE